MTKAILLNRLALSVIVNIICVHSFAQPPRILVPFRAGNKWGYSDTLGKIKIPPRYDKVTLFDKYGVTRNRHILATVWLKGKSGVLNDAGELLVPPNYDYVEAMYQLKDFAFLISRNGKKGVFSKGRELIPPVYDEVRITGGAYFKVLRNKKYGLMNQRGQLVVPVAYDGLKEVYDYRRPDSVRWEGHNAGEKVKTYEGRAERVYGADPSLIGFQMQLSEDMQGPQGDATEAIATAKTEYGLDSIQFRKNSGIVYKNGKQGVFLPKEVKSVYFFSKPYTVHHIKYLASKHNGTVAYIVASVNGKYGMINESEIQILPFEYDGIEERDGIFLLKQNGKVGFFIWNTIYPFIPPVYDELLWKGLLPVNNEWNFLLFQVLKNGKAGYVGENGIPFFKD
jgi:hypothetical protein